MVIDVTNELLTYVRNALPNVKVLSSYPSTIPSFPCVVIDEFQNITSRQTVDTAGEHHNDVSIQIDIFTNSEDKISEAKSIRSSIDSVLSGLYRIERTFSGNVPNYEDTNVYRYTMRYSFLVDSDRKIFRR